MQACFKDYIKFLNGVKVSIIKEPKLLFEQTQLNNNIYIMKKAYCAVNKMGFYGIMVVE